MSTREITEWVAANPVKLNVRQVAILVSLCDAGLKYGDFGSEHALEEEIVYIRHTLHEALGPLGDYISYT
jgi:hypothetical protein